MQGKRILLGVTGGIAAYKSPDLVRRLRERGAEVQVVMTAAAARVRHRRPPFRRSPGARVRSDLWDAAAEAAMGHIELARWADVVLIAPASADFLARLATGQADDLLTTLCLATAGARRGGPGDEPPDVGERGDAGQRRARSRRAEYSVLGPGRGRPGLRRESAPGRMLEPLDLVERVAAAAAGQRRRSPASAC